MMRLIKDSSNELGIIISSKKNTGNGMSGYTIAHIEPRGLIDRSGHEAEIYFVNHVSHFSNLKLNLKQRTSSQSEF